MIARTLVALALCSANVAVAQRALPSEIEISAGGCPDSLVGPAIELLRIELPVSFTPVEQPAGDAIIELACAEPDVRVRIVDRGMGRGVERRVVLADVAEASRARVLALTVAELLRASWPVLERPADAQDATSATVDATVLPTSVPDSGPPPDPPPTYDAFAFGLQLAGDGSFEVYVGPGVGGVYDAIANESLMPQIGAILHARLSDRLSIRIVPAFAYVPMPSSMYNTLPGDATVQTQTEHQFMTELRIGLGALVIPELDARGFVSARTIHRYMPDRSAVIAVHTSPDPLFVTDQPESWRHTLSFLAGTEWTLYPEDSRILELTCSLALGIRVAPDPAGDYRLESVIVIDGALAIGVLLDK